VGDGVADSNDASAVRLIVGAGGFGREVFELLTYELGVTVQGFLDDGHPPASPPLKATHLGGVAVPAHHDVPCVVAVGYPPSKRAVAESLDEIGRPVSPPVVHPRAEVGRAVELADGSIVTAGVVATTNIRCAPFTTLHPGALLGHDVVCDRYVSVMPGAAISGNVHLSEGVFVGTNAAILQGVRVGPWAVVGAGAVVTEDVDPGLTVVGVPAQPVAGRPS
jgi:sugar O-acyltransferase (sialic acid O-acetyltransferase NeuD family)